VLDDFSVCPSVCLMPDHKSRMQVHRKLNIGRKETHDMGHQ